MKRTLPPILMLIAAPVLAERPRAAPVDAGYADYVRARVADDLGALDVAAAGFAAAAADDPADLALTLRALRQAIEAGDMPLALRMAHALDARGALPPDGTLLLTSEAIGAKDWKRAGLLTDRIEREKLFAFLAPTIRAWIAFGQHRGDPLAVLAAGQDSPLAASYLGEHRALLLLAGGRTADGIAALDALKLPPGARTARLRISAAAIVARRDRDAAQALLVGADGATARARALLAARQRLPGAIDTAAEGVAELFVRVAADIDREQSAALALEFARLATYLAPDEAEPWLVAAGLLAAGGDDRAALAALAHVRPDDPFMGAARDGRIAALMRAGRTDEAMAEAQRQVAAADARSGDWARLGDVEAARGHWGEAARAYAKAVALTGDAAPADARWPLLLQQASAELQAGDWPAARATARAALAIAPDQPALLNFLGYSELDHGGDVAAASALIARASALAPDDAAITDSLGWSWYVRGDLARAIPLLERAARAAPAESDINDHLGDAYWRAGRRTEARYAWRAALVGADAAAAAPIRAKLADGPAARP